MTLKEYIESFYGLMMARNNWDLNQTLERFPRHLVKNFLNLGWEKAAQDTNAIISLKKWHLVKDQEDYPLPPEICKLHRVGILSGGEICKILIPEEAIELERPNDTIPSGIPQRCSWKLQARDNIGARYELRLLPPANWSEPWGLWIVISVLPAPISEETESPNAPGALGQMGLFWACYLASGNAQFVRDYRELERSYIKTGLLSSLQKLLRPLRGGV